MRFLLLLFFCNLCYAENKPIKIVFGYPAGSSHEFIFRTIDDSIKDKKINFIYEYRVGVGAGIAQEYVANSKSDGQTLLFSAGSIVNNFLFNPNLKFNIDSFDPIIYFGSQDNVIIVNPSLPYKNIKELISYAKRNPNKISFAHNGISTQGYWAIKEIFGNTEILDIPYKTSLTAMMEVAEGQVDIHLLPLSAAIGFNKTGKIKIFATTGLKRSKTINIPTISESIPNFNSIVWSAVFSPKGTSIEKREYISNYLKTGLNEKSNETLTSNGFNIEYKNMEELQKLMNKEYLMWKNKLNDYSK